MVNTKKNKLSAPALNKSQDKSQTNVADKHGKIYIGTSGWMYKDWRKKFYPPETKDFLGYFSSQFNTLEINNSFYHMPKMTIFEKWYNGVPKDFVFAVKLNRYLTHTHRLKDPNEYREYLEEFLTNAAALKEKLGPILVQLPPSFKYEPERIACFMGETDKISSELKLHIRFAHEPRHPSWFTDGHEEIYKTVRISPVFAESSRFKNYEPNKMAETEIVYLRFHGPKEFAASAYGDSIKPWARKIKQWASEGTAVYVYFNNDIHGYAVDDASLLKNLTQA